MMRAIYRSGLPAYFALLAVLPAFSQTVSPTSLSFGNQAQGTASSAQKVTLKNSLPSAITITSITANLADFAATNNCPPTLAATTTCTISIVFAPTAVGARSGTLKVVDSGSSSPQTVALSGTGTAPVLVSIAVTPATPSVAAGYTQQFIATGTYSNGTTQNLTSTATWTSSKAGVATINSAGLATTVAPGSATITAKSGTISGSAMLTVTAPLLTSIAVTPATPSVAAGYTKQFTATGTYSNKTTQNLTSTATWTSSANSIATVSSGGLATSTAPGTSTITATSGTISGSATLTVTAPLLTSIAITPATPSVAAGYTQQFTAIGTYSNGTTKNLTSTAGWTSSATSIATISGGLATGEVQGSATITAKSGTISSSATLTVTPAVLTSISITPATASVAAGYTQQFTATGTYSNKTTQNLTSTATWASSANSIATVSSAGLATSITPGSSTITAMVRDNQRLRHVDGHVGSSGVDCCDSCHTVGGGGLHATVHRDWDLQQWHDTEPDEHCYLDFIKGRRSHDQQRWTGHDRGSGKRHDHRQIGHHQWLGYVDSDSAAADFDCGHSRDAFGGGRLYETVHRDGDL